MCGWEKEDWWKADVAADVVERECAMTEVELLDAVESSATVSDVTAVVTVCGDAVNWLAGWLVDCNGNDDSGGLSEPGHGFFLGP